MDQLTGLFTDHMHTEQFHFVFTEDEFEQPVFVANDRTAGIAAVSATAYHIRNLFLIQALLRFRRPSSIPVSYAIP